MRFTPTHTGVIFMRHRHVSARIELRETKLFYVSKYGSKYRKTNGDEVQQHVNWSKLDLTTIMGIGDECVRSVDGEAT